VLHLLLEGFLLQLLIADDAVGVEGEYVRYAVGAIAIVENPLDGELVAQLELLVIGEAFIELAGLVLMKFKHTADELHLVLHALLGMLSVEWKLLAVAV
jgi:hypothetical protein